MTTKAQLAARLLGRKGGKARAANVPAEKREEWSKKGGENAQALLTPEERSRRARVGWEKRRKAKREKGETC